MEERAAPIGWKRRRPSATESWPSGTAPRPDVSRHDRRGRPQGWRGLDRHAEPANICRLDEVLDVSAFAFRASPATSVEMAAKRPKAAIVPSDPVGSLRHAAQLPQTEGVLLCSDPCATREPVRDVRRARGRKTGIAAAVKLLGVLGVVSALPTPANAATDPPSSVHSSIIPSPGYRLLGGDSGVLAFTATLRGVRSH